MRVLALSTLFPNVVMPEHGIFVRHRLQAIARRVDLRVINPVPWSPLHPLHPRYRPWTAVGKQERTAGMTVDHPRFLSFPGVWKGVEGPSCAASVGRLARGLVGTFPFDIVDMHWTWPDLPAGLAVAREHGKASLVTIRGKEALFRSGSARRAAGVVDGLRRVDRIITVSQELADICRMLIGPNEKTWVIGNGVDTSTFAYQPTAEARARLGLPGRGRILLAVGSLIRRKGFDLLIAALHELGRRESPRDLRLFIVGAPGPEGDDRAALETQVRRLDLQEQVVFVGHVPQARLPLWYNAADLFCLPSRGEGSPNVLAEAVACGCPCVAADVGGVRDLLGGNEPAGQCFAPGSVEDLVGALRHGLSAAPSQDERADRAARARKLDWEGCAERVLEVYESVGPGARGRGSS